MPAPHYAVSEALIVLAALWAAYRLAARRAWLASLGAALFGAAAAIGTVRFGLGRIEELSAIHREFSQIGGAAGMALIALQLAMAPARPWIRGAPVALALAGVTVIAGLAVPGLATPLFLAWLIVAIACVALWPNQTGGQRLARGAAVSVFLLNLLVIRRSPMLGPDLSWHLFHVLVAVWLIGMVWIHRSLADSVHAAREIPVQGSA